VFPVCGNTFRMLQQTRFAPHFSFIGDDENHFGLFEGCGSTIPFQSAMSTNGGSHKRHLSATGPIAQQQAPSELKLPPFVELALWKGMVLPQPSNRPKWFS